MINLDTLISKGLIPRLLQRSRLVGAVSAAHVCLKANLPPYTRQQACEVIYYQTVHKYWNKLKQRLGKEGSQLVTNCNQLNMTATNGK